MYAKMNRCLHEYECMQSKDQPNSKGLNSICKHLGYGYTSRAGATDYVIRVVLDMLTMSFVSLMLFIIRVIHVVCARTAGGAQRARAHLTKY